MTEQRVAIITGGARNIGAAIARRLANDGCAVVVNYHTSRNEAEALVAELGGPNDAAMAIAGDVGDARVAAEIFAAARERFGGVDILVNNAGRDMGGTIAIADTDEALYDALFAANTKAPFNMMREAARSPEDGGLRDGGRIINISTSLVGLALPGRALYAATKAAVEVMTAVLTKELRGRAITVNAVAPGPVGTTFLFKGKTDAEIDGLAKQPPLERLGTPAEIAEVVAFLASDAGGWINGQVVRANGGLV